MTDHGKPLTAGTVLVKLKQKHRKPTLASWCCFSQALASLTLLTPFPFYQVKTHCGKSKCWLPMPSRPPPWLLVLSPTRFPAAVFPVAGQKIPPKRLCPDGPARELFHRPVSLTNLHQSPPLTPLTPSHANALPHRIRPGLPGKARALEWAINQGRLRPWRE